MTEPRVTLTPAEVWPVGQYIRDELRARELSEDRAATELGVRVQDLRGVIEGNKLLTPEIAEALQRAWGTHADTWMTIEALHRMWELTEYGGGGQSASRAACRWAVRQIQELAGDAVG